MASWHNKHVSTKWGVAILGFFVVTTALLIPVLSQSQDSRSRASSYSIGILHGACHASKGKTGICKLTSETCSGYFDSGNYCNGGNNEQCCIAKADAKCNTPNGSGYCENISRQAKYNNAPGSFDPRPYCPGPQDVQCYVSKTQNNSSGNSSNSLCVQYGGSCQDKRYYKPKVVGKYWEKINGQWSCPGTNANTECWMPVYGPFIYKAPTPVMHGL